MRIIQRSLHFMSSYFIVTHGKGLHPLILMRKKKKRWQKPNPTHSRSQTGKAYNGAQGILQSY